jgi:hypothetical protein
MASSVSSRVTQQLRFLSSSPIMSARRLPLFHYRHIPLTPLFQNTLPASSVPPTPSVRWVIISCGVRYLRSTRTSGLYRAQRPGRLSVPRYPSLRRSGQWGSQHDCRSSPLDECQDGNFQGGGLQSHQARYQKGPLALRAQLLPPPRVHLELWCFPPGQSPPALP